MRIWESGIPVPFPPLVLRCSSGRHFVGRYASLWQDVLDVSATEPFDLLCREGDRELRVEVKGTGSLGLSILLTRNEVRHAQENKGHVALFVVSNIAANAAGCAGGTVRIIEPWDILECELEPVAFDCLLPARRGNRTQRVRRKRQPTTPPPSA